MTPSMHRIWSIPDLLSLILDSTDDFNDKIKDKVLLSLALTSKLFTEAALCRLWATQKTLDNVVKTLPADLIQESTGLKDQITFTRKPDKSDWERFDQYAAKITDLMLVSMPNIEERSLVALMSSIPDHQLFPRLKTLNIIVVADCEESTHLIRLTNLILCDSISSLRVSILPNLPGTNDLLSSIPRLCKNLQLFHWRWLGPHQNDHIQAVNTAVRHLPKLRDVDTGVLDATEDVAKYFMSLGHLQCLKSVLVEKGSKLVESDLWDGGLAVLEELSLAPLQYCAATNVLQRLHSQGAPLRKLILDHHLLHHYGYTPEAPTYSEIFDLVSVVANFTNLTELEIFPKDNIVGAFHENEARLLTSKLLTLRNLRNLKLQALAAQYIDDEWLEQASESFPQLEHLGVTYGLGPGGEWAPRATLKGLVPLLTKCHHLQGLHLTVKCDPFDVRPLYSTSFPPSPKTVVFQDSPFNYDAPLPLLRCLLVMFPCVSYIRGSADTEIDGGLLHANWTKLDSLLDDSMAGAR